MAIQCQVVVNQISFEMKQLRFVWKENLMQPSLRADVITPAWFLKFGLHKQTTAFHSKSRTAPVLAHGVSMPGSLFDEELIQTNTASNDWLPFRWFTSICKTSSATRGFWRSICYRYIPINVSEYAVACGSEPWIGRYNFVALGSPPMPFQRWTNIFLYKVGICKKSHSFVYFSPRSSYRSLNIFSAFFNEGVQ